MVEGSNKQVIQQFIKEIVNNQNYTVLEDLVHPNAVWHGTTGEIKSLAEYKQLITSSDGARAFTNSHFIIHDIIEKEDKVVVRFTHNAFHKASFLGHAATNKPVSWEGMAIFRLENQKIQETWMNEDLFSLTLQLEILKLPG
jgi:predicted ester cyclase